MSRDRQTSAADDTLANDVRALLTTAVGHHQAGRFGDAEAGYRRLLALQPARADVLFNLAAALRQQDRLEEAAEAYRQTVALASDYADAHYNLGNTLMALGRLPDAVAAYRGAVAARSDFATAYVNLGVALQQQGALEEAVTALRRAVTAAPEFVEAHATLGAVLTALGRPEEAATAWRDTIRLKPGFAQAHYNLGTALDALGQPDEAAAAYRAAITADPTLVEAHSNLGNILSAQGQLDGAIACFRRALVLAPERPGLHYNLGNALNSRGTLEDAATAFRQAIALKPDHADARANLAIVLMNQGRLDEADAEFRRALVIAPDNADIRSNWLFCLNYRTDISAEDMLAAHRNWETRLLPAPPPVHANHRVPARRLRIGYVSPDLRQHSVAYFIEPLLAAHDRRAVEVTCYAEVSKPDRMTARLQALADHWVSTVGLIDDDLTARIKADAIDILVDCAGHTAHNRLPVFTRKPAPVQATWLGYPNSTGLSAIDYRIVDAVTDPAGAPASERLVRLPGFLCYGGADDAPQAAPPPCLGNGTITFGSFNNPAKLSDPTLDAWAALLTRLTDARLLLKGKPFADKGTRALYRDRLAARGIPPARVELIGWSPGSVSHLKLYERIDIALDPFPYNGTTTTCEALWMGVPVIALKGDRHSGRVGASLLARIGADEWVADTSEDYVARAARLAADPSQLTMLRKTLRARVAASPLCDRVAFARAMEAVYRDMWQSWCAAGA